VNGSGKFIGVAKMTSEVDYHANFNYWSQGSKYKGFFFLVWLAIKDIPNKIFRHFINPYNENKPVTTSRDTQEIPEVIGHEMLKMIMEYPYESSILDDFAFYDQRQEELMEYKNQQQQQQLYDPRMHGEKNMVYGLEQSQGMNYNQGGNFPLKQQMQMQMPLNMNQQKMNIIRNPNTSMNFNLNQNQMNMQIQGNISNNNFQSKGLNMNKMNIQPQNIS
jgi:hypothetical protein